MMPALPRSPGQAYRPRDCLIIDSVLSTMPARHRERYSSSPQKLSTITPNPCPRSAGITVHVALETLSTMSRNTQVIGWYLGQGEI
jgi:hypothetical protein